MSDDDQIMTGQRRFHTRPIYDLQIISKYNNYACYVIS